MEQKEQAEFTELLQKYSSMVLRIAFSNVKNLQDAQDIAQEVFISVLTKRPQFDSEEHEKAWLIRVTINRCKNHVKSFWNRHTEGLSEDLSYLPEEETGVMQAVLALPQNSRNVIHLTIMKATASMKSQNFYIKSPPRWAPGWRAGAPL